MENITCDLTIYILDQPDLTTSNFMENSIGPKRVNGLNSLSHELELFQCFISFFIPAEEVSRDM